MAKRALYSVEAGGSNISALLAPVLTSLSVSDKVGTHADTANLAIDDTGGRIILPRIGARLVISLGWSDQGLRQVFDGTVDEITSSGSRSAGRALMLTAKGMDTTGKAKEGQQRHWDSASVATILRDAAAPAGITEIEIDPALAGITRAYFEMRDESLIHAAERLAREIGGNFRLQGKQLILSRRGTGYSAQIDARWGDNLHSWDMTPALGRTRFSAVRTRWYDLQAAAWRVMEDATALRVDAVLADRLPRANAAEASEQNRSDRATSERDAGGGTVVIEGNTAAIPDGLCILSGARPGVDGAYRIESVTHSYSRGGGFVTTLTLREPQGRAGTDPR